jgi:hypothetical protein
MKNILAMIVFVLFAFTTGVNGQAKKQVTIHGSLVDVVAFVTSGAATDSLSVLKSARAGNPLGLYDSKAKKMYIVGSKEINRSANETLIPYIGMRTFIVGKVYVKNGVNVILMSDVGKSIK